jgi:hypothetical protein
MDVGDYALGMAVIHWNGTDLPEALRSLPAGDYVVAPAGAGAEPVLNHLD